MNGLPNECPDPEWEDMVASGFLSTRPVVYFREAGSTNQIALAIGRQGMPAGTLVIAEGQTRGRGRMSRSWISPPGAGLYFSLITQTKIPIADAPQISLATAVALCGGIEDVCGLAPQIKWPNDILLDGKKCGGILAEIEPITDRSDGGSVANVRDGAGATGLPESPNLLVVGVGLNVTTKPADLPEEIRHRATSILACSDRIFPRTLLLRTILQKMDEIILLLEAKGLSPLLAQWEKRDALQGANLFWITSTGAVVGGVSLGLGDRGILRIRDHEGRIHEAVSGDVHCDCGQ